MHIHVHVMLVTVFVFNAVPKIVNCIHNFVNSNDFMFKDLDWAY